MPFDPPLPRPFTTTSVQAYAPAASGIYGISNAREWIFINVTNNIRSALLAHLEDPLRTIMGQLPTGFVFEVCDVARLTSRHDRLVFEYEPTLNRRGRR